MLMGNQVPLREATSDEDVQGRELPLQQAGEHDRDGRKQDGVISRARHRAPVIIVCATQTPHSGPGGTQPPVRGAPGTGSGSGTFGRPARGGARTRVVHPVLVRDRLVGAHGRRAPERGRQQGAHHGARRARTVIRGAGAGPGRGPMAPARRGAGGEPGGGREGGGEGGSGGGGAAGGGAGRAAGGQVERDSSGAGAPGGALAPGRNPAPRYRARLLVA